MLHVEHLVHEYVGGPRIVYPDIRLASGQTLMLTGNSGCGKSTLLGLLTGLLPVQSGRVEVAGEALHAMSAARRDAWRGRRVGFLPQRLHVNPGLTVLQNLELALFAMGVPADGDALRAGLERMGLGAQAMRKASTLSGGEIQRLALLRATLNAPQLLVADEPTASLDDVHARLCLEWLLRSVNDSQAILIVATHDGRARQWLMELQPLSVHLHLEALA